MPPADSYQRLLLFFIVPTAEPVAFMSEKVICPWISPMNVAALVKTP